MAHIIRPAKGGKVLSFEQDGKFYYRSGMAKMDKNDLVGAMASYRIALEKDPDNPDIILSIAEILTAMERYDESNRLLLIRFRNAEMLPEVYFGMGCNFMAQRQYEQARVSFDKYLDMEPEGEYAFTAYDMAEAIDDGTAPGQNMPYSREQEMAELGRRRMEQEDFPLAVETLEKVLEEAPEFTRARNDLALAYYCMREYTKATEQVGVVLRKEPGNIQAHCNLAVFMRGAKDDIGLKRAVDYLKTVDTDDVDDLNRIAVTLMEAREFSIALGFAKKLYVKRPYDSGAIHRLGLCCYYTGDYAAAAGCYDKLLKIDRHDSIAKYYKSACRAAQEGRSKNLSLMLNYQVPAEEVVARMRRLNELIKLPREELNRQWYPGSDVEILAKWGLTLPDISVKRAMLSLVASFKDVTAEYILRDFALRPENSVEIKRDAFGLLKSIGAAEPYLSYIDGELMESRVSLVPSMPKGLPKTYAEIMENCIRFMRGIRGDDCISEAINIWSAFLEELEGYRPLTKGQVAALAAAIEYEACRRLNVDATKWELCSKYGISITRFNNAMAKLHRKKEDKGEDRDE